MRHSSEEGAANNSTSNCLRPEGASAVRAASTHGIDIDHARSGLTAAQPLPMPVGVPDGPLERAPASLAALIAGKEAQKGTC
jgi:hypothetical protein